MVDVVAVGGGSGWISVPRGISPMKGRSGELSEPPGAGQVDFVGGSRRLGCGPPRWWLVLENKTIRRRAG